MGAGPPRNIHAYYTIFPSVASAGFWYNTRMNLNEEIARLKRERNAVVLAHNYCRGEVQDAADFTGDSLELARRATQVEADVIVFCGVYFMAETAKILNPGRKVLVPDPSAGCPMADMITAAQLRELKAKHPGAKAVCYVNSTAEVKAECDICVTSGNAEKVMRAFAPDEEILFVPDRHLGSHIAGLLGREYTLWPGYCPTHQIVTFDPHINTHLVKHACNCLGPVTLLVGKTPHTSKTACSLTECRKHGYDREKVRAIGCVHVESLERSTLDGDITTVAIQL